MQTLRLLFSKWNIINYNISRGILRLSVDNNHSATQYSKCQGVKKITFMKKRKENK